MNDKELEQAAIEGIKIDEQNKAIMAKPMTPVEWAESLRVVHCMSKKDFEKAFGDDADYMWSKYTVHFEGKESDFICYLDLDNQRRLFRFCLAKMRGVK